MTPEENVAAVRDFIERAWNQGDESVFEEHLAEDFEGFGGRDDFKAVILGFRAKYPDLKMEVHDIFGADDRVVTRFTITGTDAERSAAFKGIAIDVMRGDQRVAGWAQLGAVED